MFYYQTKPINKAFIGLEEFTCILSWLCPLDNVQWTYPNIAYIVLLLRTTYSACVGQGTIHDAFLIAEKNNRGEEEGEQQPAKKWDGDISPLFLKLNLALWNPICPVIIHKRTHKN